MQMNKSRLLSQNSVRQTCNAFGFKFIKDLIKRKDVLHIGCLVEKVINHIALTGFTTNILLLHLNACRKKKTGTAKPTIWKE